jgi:hypothetical protein
MSDCIKKSTTIYLNKVDTTFEVNRKTDDRYRVNYAQIAGGDLTVSINVTSWCNIFVATDCEIGTSPTAPNLLANGAVNKTSKKTFNAAEIATWASRIDEEGYVYFRFNNTNDKFKVTLRSTAPEEKDPVYPAMTVSVSCDESGNAYFRVSEDQHVVILEGTTEKHSFDAVVGQTYTISDLPAGTYTLRGQNDEIVLKL